MSDAQALVKDIATAWLEAAGRLMGVKLPERPRLAMTPRTELMRDGSARLYRFARPAAAARGPEIPVLLVPSLINQWYVLDLRPGGSLVEALTAGGIDTFCLDWGAPEAEDRHLSWDDVLARLARAIRRVKRESGSPTVALLGYCMGGTLATIHAAQHPDEIAALIDLAGPIDFGKAGRLARMVDRRWFDADAIADAGNVSPAQMQSGFVALRPTLELAKLAAMPETAADPVAREAMAALEAWSSDNIAFPGDAYRTYIRELYQGNALVAGTHMVGGRAVDLGAIRCPTLAIVADRDNICPAEAAVALTERVASEDTAIIRVKGGHVGAVVGRAAARDMYPAVLSWLHTRLGSAH